MLLGKLNIHVQKTEVGQGWWHISVIPALRRLRQEDCMFKANLGYKIPLKHLPC
jgi:hypothetical protein